MLSRKAAKIYFLVFPSWGSHRTDIKSVLKIGTNVQEEKQTYLSTKKNLVRQNWLCHQCVKTVGKIKVNHISPFCDREGTRRSFATERIWGTLMPYRPK